MIDKEDEVDDGIPPVNPPPNTPRIIVDRDTLSQRIVGLGSTPILKTPQPPSPLEVFENLVNDFLPPVLKAFSFEVKSTTRPRDRELPQKPFTEEKRHLREHKEMMRDFKKRVAAEEEEKRRKKNLQLEKERRTIELITIWEEKILPFWEKEKSSSKTRELWWEGIPPRIREKVWLKAAGNSLQITKELFTSLLATAHGKMVLIKKTQSTLQLSKPKSKTPENSIPQNANPENENKISKNTIPENGIPEKVIPENTIPENSTPRNTISEKIIPENTIPENSTPRNTISEKIISENIVPENAIPQNSTPRNTIPEKTIPENAIPENAIPENTFSENISLKKKTLDLTESFFNKNSVISIKERKYVEQIQLDLPRTFPALSFFQDDGPCALSLRQVLEAYMVYKPELGYVQGMSYIAASLLLSMSTYEAFQCMCNIINNQCHVVFYSMDIDKMEWYFNAFNLIIATHLPVLYKHLCTIDLHPRLYLIDWVLTIFTKSLPIDVAAHLLDVYLLEGEYFLFRAGAGLLKLLGKKIIDCEFEEVMSLLRRLSEEEVEEEKLFESIRSIPMNSEEFQQYLLMGKEIAYHHTDK